MAQDRHEVIKSVVQISLARMVLLLADAAKHVAPKFATHEDVEKGGPVVAYRAGYVMGFSTAMTISTCMRRGESFTRDEVADAILPAALGIGWVAFGIDQLPEIDHSMRFRAVIIAAKSQPEHARGFQIGYEDGVRVHEQDVHGFVPRLALAENVAQDVRQGKPEPAEAAKQRHEVRTAYDQLRDITIRAFRAYGEHRGIAPKTMTDDEIIDVYRKVVSAFREAAEQRGERIPGVYLTTIAFKFFQLYEQPALKDFFDTHLQYELKHYRDQGLREDYKIDLGIFPEPA